MIRFPRPFLLAALLLLFSAKSFAVVYSTRISITDEQDLYELNAKGAITDDELESLVDLLHEGVDLNTASREDLYELPNVTYEQADAIIAYRTAATTIDEPADLVRAGVFTPEELKEIAPFLLMSKTGTSVPLNGEVNLHGTYLVGDPLGPPFYSQLQVRAPLGISAGVLAATTRQKVGPLEWDPSRAALTATAPRYGLEVPKFYAQWKGSQRKVVLGSFRAGFGQRLTLDNTSHETPDGIYADVSVLRLQRVQSSFCRFTGASSDPSDPSCTDFEHNEYVAPDYRWRDPFRGAAATIQDLSLGNSGTQVGFTGLASYATRALSQYQLYNPTNCADPHADNLSACAAPPFYIRKPDGSIASTRYDFVTIPAVFDELTAGGNVNVRLAPGRRFGVTGYWSRPIFRVPNVDFQEWAKYPYGGPFGAIGLDGAWELGNVNFFAEAARSFDSMPQSPGGGFGVIERNVYSLKNQQAEVSFRYYDRNFVNPYARAFSEPDRLDGQRVRNELGARVQYFSRLIPETYARADFDVWTLPGDAATPNTAGTTNLRAAARLDYEHFYYFFPGLWADYRNKGVGQQPNEASYCYEVSTSTDSEGDALPCVGSYMRVIQRVELFPKSRYIDVLLQAAEKWVDDPSDPSGKRFDFTGFIELSSQPVETIRLRARTKYLDEAFGNATRGETSIWTFFQAFFALPGRTQVGLRYDNYLYLDQRPSTLTRIPNPSHRVSAEVEARF